MNQDKWNILIQDTLSLEPLLVTARKTDLSERTMFRMKHKFLLLLEKLVSTSELDGVIECDETFVLESRKGTKPNDRKAEKDEVVLQRESYPMSKFVLSSQQIGKEQNLLVSSTLVNRQPTQLLEG